MKLSTSKRNIYNNMHNDDNLNLEEIEIIMKNENEKEKENGNEKENEYCSYSNNNISKKNIIKYIIYYYIHVVLVLSFEVLFYFYYITFYEKQLIFDLIDRIPKVLINMIPKELLNYFLDEYDMDNIKNICSYIPEKDISSNTDIYNKSILILIILFLILFLMILYETNFFRKKNYILLEFRNAIIILLFIGIFDYIFFLYVISQYKLINSNEIIHDIFFIFLLNI